MSVVTLVVVLTAAILAVLAVVGVVVFGVYRRRYRAAMEPLAAEIDADAQAFQTRTATPFTLP